MAPKISELLAAKDPKAVTVSFEYYPPKTEKGVKNLYDRIELMKKADPMFMDVTWGAGGGTSDLTLELCDTAQKNYGVVANMHLTCTNMEAKKVDVALEGAKAAGITNIVALRGDPPVGQTEWKAVASGFDCALDLVRYIRKNYENDFCLSVAGYPEGHPLVIGEDGKVTPENMKKELDYLKQKVDAGGDLIITQIFLDVGLFNKFVEDCREMGITCPVLPGLLVIQSYNGYKKMTQFCKTYIPPEVEAKLEEIKDDAEAVKAYGIDLCLTMCKALIEAGHTHLHFYCLNAEGPTFAVMEKLGLPVPAAADA